MSGSDITPEAIREALTPFGVLRAQFPAEWTGEVTLHPSLTRFYEEVGPCGEDGPRGPNGLTIPTTGNPFGIAPLARLWDRQAGYRWHALSDERLDGWRDEWLVVADQGGDPFILDGTTGAVLHARHGEGAWKPEPMFGDVFVMALVLGTIGTVHELGGDGIYDEEFEVRPEWRAALRARLVPILGETEAERISARFGW